MRHLKQAYAQTNRSDFEIIGIVCNDTPDRLQKFLEKEGVKWPQVMANSTNKLIETYQVKSYPTTLLIDPDGKVLIPRVSGSNLAGFINQLISSKH